MASTMAGALRVNMEACALSQKRIFIVSFGDETLHA